MFAKSYGQLTPGFVRAVASTGLVKQLLTRGKKVSTLSAHSWLKGGKKAWK
jgi:hypothetical protein